MESKADAAAVILKERGLPYERGLALMHADETARLEALEVFETLGAKAVAAKLRKSLRDAGVAVPRGKNRRTRTHAEAVHQARAQGLTAPASAATFSN